MGKKPESKHLCFVGNIIEIHYRPTDYTSYSDLARAANIDPSYLSRIRYGEKVGVKMAVWRNLAVSLANGQVNAGKCPASAMVQQAKFILMQLITAIAEEESFAQVAEEHTQDLNERRAIREEQDLQDLVAWKEKREDRRRDKDSEKRRKEIDEGDEDEKRAVD